jgi:hypothetical protein
MSFAEEDRRERFRVDPRLFAPQWRDQPIAGPNYQQACGHRGGSRYPTVPGDEEIAPRFIPLFCRRTGV